MRDGPARTFADATPAQIRAALLPEEAVEFDLQWRRAMAEATAALDLGIVHATLDEWRRVARLTAAQGAEAHRRMYRRAASRWVGIDIPEDEPLPRTKGRLGL